MKEITWTKPELVAQIQFVVDCREPTAALQVSGPAPR